MYVDSLIYKIMFLFTWRNFLSIWISGSYNERESNIIYKSTVRPENFLYTNYNWSISLSNVHPALPAVKYYIPTWVFVQMFFGYSLVIVTLLFYDIQYTSKNHSNWCKMKQKSIKAVHVQQRLVKTRMKVYFAPALHSTR